MTENRRQVLEMVAAGKITAEEGDRLLTALDATDAGGSSKVATRPTAKYLRVIIDSNDKDEGPTHINVRVPIMLLRAGVRLASLIPGPAQEKVNEALRKQGVPFDVSQIKPENLNEIIDHLTDVSVDIDQKAEDTKIQIFAE